MVKSSGYGFARGFAGIC